MKGWGHLTKVYGQISYGISPFEQKLFKGYMKHTMYNWFNRYVKDNFFVVVIPTVGAYMWYDWAKKTNLKLKRKNPADYANDV